MRPVSVRSALVPGDDIREEMRLGELFRTIPNFPIVGGNGLVEGGVV
jgi:hypothetical protein